MEERNGTEECNDILEVNFDFYKREQLNRGFGMIIIATDDFDEKLKKQTC